MKFIFIIFGVLLLNVYSSELKITADSVEGDEIKGISILRGNVKMTKDRDELNASNIFIYTNKKREPVKYKADGNVSLKLFLDNGSEYRGKANRVEYDPLENKYSFYGDVRLEQVDEKKIIIGEKVIVNVNSGAALAEGTDTTPVTIIFDIKDKNSTKRSQ